MLRRLIGPGLLLGVSLFGRSAAAQDAQALFDEGLADMKAGRVKIGCALIKRSLDLDPRPGTVFTLAECYSRAGKYASAVAYYDHYLSLVDQMAPEQREGQSTRVEISHTERNRLVGLVAWLTVSLPAGTAPGVVVTMDGEAFDSGLFGAATAADPGPHLFTTRAPDGPLIEQRVELAPGERKDVVLDVRAPGSIAPPEEGDGDGTPPPEEGTGENPPPRKRISTWVYVAGGIGAAGLITGSITGVMLLQKRSVIFDECDPPDANGRAACSAKGKEAADVAKGTLAPITEVAFGIGAAGAITAVLLWVTDTGTPPRSSASRTIPLVSVGPRGATLGLSTTF